MKTLLLLRHAKSSWDDPFCSDHNRPLNKRGLRDAPRMGKLLKDQNLVPEWILSSTANRAKTTTEIIAKHCGFEGKIKESKKVYEGSAETYQELIRKAANSYERILLVGHNPCMEELLFKLTDKHERYPTATLAHITFDVDKWSDITSDVKGKLVNLWRPKELEQAKDS